MIQIRRLNWVLVLCFGLFPLIATFAHKGTVILLGIVGSVALCTAFSEHALREVFSRKLLMYAGIGLAWLIVASFIAPDTVGGVIRILKFSVLAALFFLTAWYLRQVPAEFRKMIVLALSVGTLVALFFLVLGFLMIGVIDQQIIEIKRGDALTVLYPGLILTGLLMPGLFEYFRQQRKRSLMWLTALVALGLSVLAGSTITSVLIAITIVGYLVFRDEPGHLSRILATSLVVVTITLPVSMPLVLDRVAVIFVQDQAQFANTVDDGAIIGSVTHRYRIWRFAADRAAERPFLGWGFNVSRSLPGGHVQLAAGAELLPLHPHNAVLQIWLELGVPGLLLLCVLLWRSFLPPGWQAFERRELLTRTLTVAVIFVAASVSFGIWQSWWLSTMALVMASTSLWHVREAER